MYKVLSFYKKEGLMRLISHLDLNRLFMRALRRASIPVYITKGFSPHPKISFKKAYKLGQRVDKGELVFYLKERISLKEFENRLNAQLPLGIKIYNSHFID